MASHTGLKICCLILLISVVVLISANGKNSKRKGNKEVGKSKSGNPKNGKGGNDKVDGSKRVSGKGNSGKAKNGKSSSGKVKKGKNKKPKNGKTSNAKGKNSKSNNRKVSNGKGKNGKSKNGKVNNGKGKNGKSKDGKVNNGKSKKGNDNNGRVKKGKSNKGKAKSGKSKKGKAKSGKRQNNNNPRRRKNLNKGKKRKSAKGKAKKQKWCKREVRDRIIWRRIIAGKTIRFPCPFGPNGVKAFRKCYKNGTWAKPNFSGCHNETFVTKELIELSKIRANRRNARRKARGLQMIFETGPPRFKTRKHVGKTADILEDIVSVKDSLNETAEIVIEIVDDILEVKKISKNASTKVLNILDELAENVPMDEGKSSKVLIASNIILQANEIEISSFHGISFDVSQNDSLVSDNTTKTKLSVYLPTSLLRETDEETVRVAFIYYANNKLFQTEPDKNKRNNTPSQQVLASSVFNTTTTNLSEPVVLRFPRREKFKDRNFTCVFWKENDRQWSNMGCSLCANQSSNDSIECCCNHLTSFAVLFSPEPRKTFTASDVHARVLGLITFVGCVISLFGVALTFLTYLIFRHLRKTNQQLILMNLCVAIALLLIVFIAGINSTNNRLGCQIVAVLLHYLTLVTVLWMGIEAYNLYLQIVKVMAIYQRKFMLKAALVGWGVPLLVVMATVIAAVVEYKKSDDVDRIFYYGNDYACILHNRLYRIIAWFTPVVVILLLNLFTFITVLYHLKKTVVTVDTKNNNKTHCLTALAIMVLLGLTWLFGALAISDARIVFEYLFCIFNSLQGLFIFFFHCVRIKEVRKQWSSFVSGLGFSQRDSQTTSNKSYIRVKDWIIRRLSDPTHRNEIHGLNNLRRRTSNGQRKEEVNLGLNNCVVEDQETRTPS